MRRNSKRRYNFQSAIACVVVAVVVAFLWLLVYLRPYYENNGDDFMYVTGTIKDVPTLNEHKGGKGPSWSSIDFTLYEHPEITFHNSGDLYKMTNKYILKLNQGQHVKILVLKESYLRLIGECGNFLERFSTPNRLAFFKFYKEGLNGNYIDDMDPIPISIGVGGKFWEFTLLTLLFIAMLYHANRFRNRWRELRWAETEGSIKNDGKLEKEKEVSVSPNYTSEKLTKNDNLFRVILFSFCVLGALYSLTKLYYKPHYTANPEDFMNITGIIDVPPHFVSRNKKEDGIIFSLKEHPRIWFFNSKELCKATDKRIYELAEGEHVKLRVHKRCYEIITGASGNFMERHAAGDETAFFALYKDGNDLNYVGPFREIPGMNMFGGKGLKALMGIFVLGLMVAGVRWSLKDFRKAQAEEMNLTA